MRWPSLFREDVGLGDRKWLPLALVLGSIAIVAYADGIASSVPLGYLYVLPLGISAMFLRSEISYGLIAVCTVLHDLLRPTYLTLHGRIAHNLTGLVEFAFVVYAIQRYVKQEEKLAKVVREQRDDLLHDVELAGQVQRMFLPVGRPAIPGLDIAGMMQPARGVGGDYYDYIPIDEHTIQLVIADVAGKGVPAALLMSAAAAAMQLESNQVRNMLEIVGRLNSGIHSVSDGIRYVTLLLAEVDAKSRTLRYVNCGHNPALLFQEQTGKAVSMNSSCLPLGMFSKTACEINQSELSTGDVIVFYTDGLTEAENRIGEEFGVERLSAIVRRSSSLSAERIMREIFQAAVDFRQELGFSDDVTILVVKCNFDGPELVHSGEALTRAKNLSQQPSMPTGDEVPSMSLDISPKGVDV
jgi:sigma-B regulation protein RsbU (phosphoserine phosphatase)